MESEIIKIVQSRPVFIHNEHPSYIRMTQLTYRGIYEVISIDREFLLKLIEELQKLIIQRELKLCPFCGSPAISEDHDDNGWYIKCSHRDSREIEKCPISPGFWGDSKEEAERIWNQRII